jgi:hypothetical protein
MQDMDWDDLRFLLEPPGANIEHAADALAAVVACLASDVVRAVRREPRRELCAANGHHAHHLADVEHDHVLADEHVADAAEREHDAVALAGRVPLLDGSRDPFGILEGQA